MALIKCKVCQKEISDEAAICPNCGSPVAFSKEIVDKSAWDLGSKIAERYIADLNPVNDTHIITNAIDYLINYLSKNKPGKSAWDQFLLALLPLLEDSRESVRFHVIKTLRNILEIPQISTIDSAKSHIFAALNMNENEAAEKLNNINISNISNISKSKNKVAERLNQIGGILFTIVMIPVVIMIIVSFVVMATTFKGEVVGIPLLIMSVLPVLFAYVMKILFNGLAEIIQILHDIRGK